MNSATAPGRPAISRFRDARARAATEDERPDVRALARQAFRDLAAVLRPALAREPVNELPSQIVAARSLENCPGGARRSRLSASSSVSTVPSTGPSSFANSDSNSSSKRRTRHSTPIERPLESRQSRMRCE
ncbi:MAG: hypothetical protein O9284_10430 [Steroidobacteraceae bacterium]|nr:hypothetical protein [Steroidobacteraceae bacterium]